MEEDMLIKKKKRNRIGNYNKYTTLMFTLGLLLVLVGFSYAFFVYNRTGLYTHTITGGKMSIIYDETSGNNITLSNSYPLTDKEAETKALEFEFTITGYNESEKNIYYAIEMDYGNDVDGLTRFKDSDLKLSLFENDEIKFENEVFSNLDNNDIYYGYINQGTSSESPVTNNYKLRIWINDNVLITDTPDMVDIEGKSVYSTTEFANRYANFKVNVKADLTYDDFGYITYDANGGINAPEKTSILTGMVTRNSPYNVTKVNNQTVYNACIGWSSDPNATIPEYEKGDYYNGDGELLYAVYSSDINVMSNLTQFNTYKSQITEIYFINDTDENIDTRYSSATIKYDLSLQGKVLGWLENDYYDDATSKQYYKLYIGSEGITYLSTGVMLMYEFQNLTLIEFENIDTSMVTNMSYMFSKCSSLSSLDVSNFDTSQVIDMESMFDNCRNLIKLDVNNFDTSQVTNMSSMFRYCSELTELDLNNFDTSNVTDMSYMFAICGLTKLDLSNFDTSQVTNMSSMFGIGTNSAGKMNFKILNISNFDTSNVTDMSYLFKRCSDLTILDIANFDTSKVINMQEMFYDCRSLTNLEVSNFKTSKVQNMSEMFYQCENLITLDVGNFDTSNVTDMSSMFYFGNDLINLDISNFDTSNVRSMSRMFYYCKNLSKLDVSNFDTTNVRDMSNMFGACGSLTFLDVSKFNTSNVTNMDNMFGNAYTGINMKLETLDVKNFDTSNVTNMWGMFKGCSSLIELDVSKFDTLNVNDMYCLFDGCSKLTTLDVFSFDTSKVTDMENMFRGCSSLVELDVSNFDISKVTKMREMFSGCNNLKKIYSNSNWNTGNVTNMSYMFSGCSKLVGAVSYDATKIDITMANPDTGYFTYRR